MGGPAQAGAASAGHPADGDPHSHPAGPVLGRSGGTDGGHVIRVTDDPCALDAVAWDRLLASQAAPTPFMRHAHFAALHASACAVAATGWAPRFVTVWRGQRLVAAAPAYLKSHSYGEYVFDWAWADAHHRHGLRYYPKLLVAVPFTPVPGSRLLAEDDAARQALLAGLATLAQRERVSSMHLLFPAPAEAEAAVNAGGMARQGLQFHWVRDPTRPAAASFDDFLASLRRDKRKKIQQERRRVADAGVSFTPLRGHEIDADSWRFFHQCYQGTYRAHGATPYLNLDYFLRVADSLAEHWLMFVAWRGGQRIAASLLAIDPAQGSAYGRYWGTTEALPCLHFEACYYQPLAWCLAQGFARFEGGAQGEHKLARGMLPVGTQSVHWLADPRFAAAVQDFLAREGQGVAAYADELHEHQPFKATPTVGSSSAGPDRR